MKKRIFVANIYLFFSFALAATLVSCNEQYYAPSALCATWYFNVEKNTGVAFTIDKKTITIPGIGTRSVRIEGNKIRYGDYTTNNWWTFLTNYTLNGSTLSGYYESTKLTTTFYK
ncbi:MAG: hypothetical protein Ta2A_06950 [Treponemataceae bacterium]|nr:MAG: hypothetical protein Ta2A_06950 [Treponemataceae bacterium]